MLIQDFITSNAEAWLSTAILRLFCLAEQCHTDMTKNYKTYARGYKFELFQSIFNYIEQFSQSILVYLGLFRSIFDYLGLYRCISVYLGLSWSILDYLGLSLCISVNLSASLCILVYLGLSRTILD